jgi:hypothetical protein
LFTVSDGEALRSDSAQERRRARCQNTWRLIEGSLK